MNERNSSYPTLQEVRDALEYFKHWDWRKDYLLDDGGEIHLPILLFVTRRYAKETMININKQNWKDKTCETCIYCINYECRRYPPEKGFMHNGYNIACGFLLKYFPACAEYKETI